MKPGGALPDKSRLCLWFTFGPNPFLITLFHHTLSIQVLHIGLMPIIPFRKMLGFSYFYSLMKCTNTRINVYHH